MKKYILILVAIFILISIASNDSDRCYFESSNGVLDKRLVASVISEESLKYAKFEGAKTKGIFVNQTEVDGETIVKVKSILTAQNAFGVYSKSTFIIDASLSCQGYSLISISHNNKKLLNK